MPDIRTCEFVSPKHPDKQCDIIADSILDAFIAQDPLSRTAPEVMGGHGLVVVNGEITSHAKVDIEQVVREVVGGDYKIIVNIKPQSPEISRGVNVGGAGDQGIMIGYATAETEERMPKEYVLARGLCQKIFAKYGTDGKTQVTLEDGKVKYVVASFQNTKSEELEGLVRANIEAGEYIINPAGEWHQGGFEADSGLSGRKIIVDNYGPEVSVGGGSFSGKDWTKVDRSGAYMARRVAVDYLEKRKAHKVLVKLAYAIGKKEPVMAVVSVDGKLEKVSGYDLSPLGMRDALGLDKPIFRKTAEWGHFGRGFSWG